MFSQGPYLDHRERECHSIPAYLKSWRSHRAQLRYDGEYAIEGAVRVWLGDFGGYSGKHPIFD